MIAHFSIRDKTVKYDKSNIISLNTEINENKTKNMSPSNMNATQQTANKIDSAASEKRWYGNVLSF